MHTFYPLVDMSIRFILLLGFLLNVCNKIYIHFVYYFVLRWEFYCRFTMRKQEVLLTYVGTPQ